LCLIIHMLNFFLHILPYKCKLGKGFFPYDGFNGHGKNQ
jgi:hypothetical protein